MKHSIRRKPQRMNNLVLWGAGKKVRIVLEHIKPECIEAIIDSDVMKIGKELKGIKIIGFETYLAKYRNLPIVITPYEYNDEIAVELRNNGILHYLFWRDVPYEWYYHGVGNIDFQMLLMDNKEKNIGIYGISYYSILLFYFLKDNNYHNVHIIPHLGVSYERAERLAECFDNLVLCNNIQNCDYVYWAVHKSSRQDMMPDSIELVEAFDFTEISQSYWNFHLLKFYNIHAGERCFIVATGPSITIADLEKLHEMNEITISMNNVYKTFNSINWRPKYYVAIDDKAVNILDNSTDYLDVPVKFISETGNNFWDKPRDNSFYKLRVEFCSPNYIDFSHRIECKIFSGATVTYACIQIAMYMGFKDIYLLGVDNSFTNNVKAEENHFIKNYHDVNDEIYTPRLDLLSISYAKAKEVASLKGVNIYNATRGGKLDIFKRVDFDSLFEG